MSLMGARLCTLRHLISGQKCKSPPGRRNSGSYSFKKENRRMLMETAENNKKILALQEWILASPSPGMKPDYLKSSSSNYKQSPSKKKVHPACSSRLRGSLISEAKDSLCLDRPIMNRSHDPEGGEGMSNCPSIISRGMVISGKSQKRVSFKLPHTVIFYSPEPEERNRPCSIEDSIFSPNCRENSFDSAEEPCFRLAVDILPHLSVSSKI